MRKPWLPILAACLALAGPAHAQPIKIAFLSSLSGPFTPWGINVRDGMKLAVAEINAAGGVGGRPLELVERDDRNNAAEGVTSLKYLVEREGIVAAGGVISSDVGLAVSRETMVALGGSLDLESTPGEGTVATVRLPAPERRSVPGSDLGSRN